MKHSALPRIHLLLTAVIAVFLTSFVFGIHNLASQYRTERDKLGDVLWIASQLERDYLQLLQAIERHARRATPGTKATLQRRYEILLSRVQLFKEGESGALLGSVPGVRVTVARLDETLQRLDGTIAPNGASFDLESWRGALGPLERDVHAAVLAAFVEEESYTVSAHQSFRQSVYVSAISLVAILISGGVLICLSIAQAGRAQRAELASR